MQFKRKSGLLLHITSLPGPWGVGELGPQARAFCGYLASAGQTLWQILPTGPCGFGSSPYSALSAFAGNHLLISFDDLIADGLLSRDRLKNFPAFDPQRIDYPAMIAAREEVLFEVADCFKGSHRFTAFCRTESGWLKDYALFMALREAQSFRPWTEWPEPLRLREPAALKKARRTHAAAIRRHQVLQFLFYAQWRKLAEQCRAAGIATIGDLPIFVAGDSADVWAHQKLFYLDAEGNPTLVAGVPPDYFSATGQRWGNPLYNWAAHREHGYGWWIARMQHLLKMTDIVRIDHFRGFEAYWEIHASEPTAIHGRWIPGPGLELFRTVEAGLRRRPGFSRAFRLADHVIAENLGIITEEVEALRDACGFPGMWVLHFRFGAEPMQQAGYRPEGVETNWTVYTGTHDNDTTRSWFAGIDDAERHRVCTALHTDGRAIHRTLAELALSAPAKWALLPLQDLPGLGGEARMNTPGTVEGNWAWRIREEQLDPGAAAWLRAKTLEHGRL